MGFQHRHEADRFLKELGVRMSEQGLELHHAVKHRSLTTLRGKLIKTCLPAGITARKRLDTPTTEQKKCLPFSRSAVQSPESPTARRAGIGHGPSGKARVKHA